MTDSTYQFELYRGHGSTYRFRLKDAQGHTIGASPEYSNKKVALGAISMLKKEMPTAEVHEGSQ